MKNCHLKRLLATLLCGVMLFSVSCRDTAEETDSMVNPAESYHSDTAAMDTDTNNTVDNTPETDLESVIRTPYKLESDDKPIGTGIGIHPGRVTWAYNSDAFQWNGVGYWWLTKNFDEQIVKSMLEDTITQLAGKETVGDALDALFRDFNQRVNAEAKPYTPGQKIFIKVNLNATGNGSATNNNATGYYPSPVTMRALLELLVDFGVAPSDIAIGDPSRVMPSYVEEIITADKLKGVVVVDYDANPSKDTKADITHPVRWSRDLAADGWMDYNGKPTVNPTYWPEELIAADYMINLFNLRGHNLAGITGCAKNHFGTIMPGYTNEDGTVTFPNEFRTNPPSWAGLHHYVSAVDGFYMNPVEIWDLPKVPMGSYTVLVDLLSNKDAGGKTFLYLCDAFAATVHQGSSLTKDERFYSAPFYNGQKPGWTNSILASQDPVAIDSVCLDFLKAEQAEAEARGDRKWDMVLPEDGTAENYLIEAALADNPPSGTYYQDGYGNPIGSLGVHEHWNNAEEKQYSRNLGETEGIELIQITY